MPHDGYWLASFEVIPPPPQLVFPPKMAFHMDAHPLLKKISDISWPPQEAIITWPAPFFQYCKCLLRQNTGGACLYMPQDGHWLASFEVIPPKLVFPQPKK
jgi:hypothetical protein